MRFCILFLLSIIVVNLVGCGVGLYNYTDIARKEHINNVREIEVWTTDNFSDSDKSGLYGAMREWNKVLNGQMVLKVGGEVSWTDMDEWEEKLEEVMGSRDGWLLIKLSSEHPIVRRRIMDGTLAFVPGLGAPLMFIIEDHMGSKNMRTILMHEMGHMLGADHVNVDYTLMTPKYGPKQPDCIDLLTARQVAWFRDLDIEYMNYCVVPE